MVNHERETVSGNQKGKRPLNKKALHRDPQDKTHHRGNCNRPGKHKFTLLPTTYRNLQPNLNKQTATL